jgi:hypothetical protein
MAILMMSAVLPDRSCSLHYALMPRTTALELLMSQIATSTQYGFYIAVLSCKIYQLIHIGSAILDRFYKVSINS